MKARYWVNRKTRRCRITTGPVDAEMAREGFEEVTEGEQIRFRHETGRAKKRGWRGSPRSFHKYSDAAAAQ